MTFRELWCGACFRFEGSETVYEHRGNGWYGRPYSGGPWCEPGNPRVFLCTLEEEEHYRQWERQIHAEYALDVLAARAALNSRCVREH